MVVGVDLGGTNIRVGCVASDGSLLALRSSRSHPERGSAATLEDVAGLVDEVIAAVAQPPEAIGLAISGPVDCRTGIVNNPHTLTGWGPTDVREPLRARFGVPVTVENDANAAALGEWWRGAGRNHDRVAVITVGTGIGVGLLIHGDVQRGLDGSHGEAGHHLLDPNGPPCYCGARGCWESLAAGPALARMAAETGFRLPSAEGVIEAALAGQNHAVEMVDSLARWLGLGFVNVIAFFLPDTIIVGGGIGARCFPLLEPTIGRVLAGHDQLVPRPVAVRAAELGDSAGVFGAALTALARTS